MSLDITSGQEDATRRRTLYGAVYALSGTLLSRVNGLPDAPIRWATRSFSGGPSGDLYEEYIALPDGIEEELPFKLGDFSPQHPIDIPIRNLPFRFSDSLLAAIVDEEYAWEGSEATLYVGYLKPEQRPEDLAPSDWTSIRKLGQFGSPQNVQQDGFRLPLFSRDSLRRQTLNFWKATKDVWPNLDPLDEGRVVPVIIGAPDSWVRSIRSNAGVYGLTTGSTTSGTTSGLEIQSSFTAAQLSGLSGRQVYVHRLDKLRTVAQVVTDTNAGGVATLFFSANLDFNIPQGALVQERLPYYEFVLCAQTLPNQSLSALSGIYDPSATVSYAFETIDGRVIPFTDLLISGINEFMFFGVYEHFEAPFSRDVLTAGSGVYFAFRLYDFNETPIGITVPALVPRLNLPPTGGDVDITIDTQPEFTPSVNVIQATKQNFPTGPGGASAAFDGSENTGFSLGAFGSVTFTFPSVPGGTFDNNDTIRSILKVTSQGDILFFSGVTEFFHPTSASKDSYTILQATPRAFNQSITATAQTAGGGIVYEISWEHELETDLTIDRSTDVAASGGVITPEDIGFDMVPIKGVLCKLASSFAGEDSFAQSPWRGGTLTGILQPSYSRRCLPTSVFANLQKKYLEDGGNFSATSGDYTAFIDAASYDQAEAEYVSRNIRLNFAITEPLEWPDLERELAKQSRSHAFYGPNGHQLIVIPDTSEAEQATEEAYFRLPGTPNPNVTQPTGSPLIERTSPSDIINVTEVHWGRQYHIPTQRADASERYLFLINGEHAGSRAIFGDRYDTDGPIEAWAISNILTLATSLSPTYSGEEHAQDLADFIADRQAFARTRFSFETAWQDFGLTQGSVIRVAFAAAPNVFRNVACEVEDIRVSPINSERRVITARSIGAPQRGLVPALIWTDLFTETDDTWAERFTNIRDRWQQYFGVP